MNNSEKKTGNRVLIGLTGRVSSCVAAFLLKKQGFDVIGITIVTGNNSDYVDEDLAPKCHIQDIEKVRDFCEKIKIPFYATDIKSQFENDVMDPLFANKLTGRANNSCFNCTRLRVSILHEKMKQLRADYIATGHFCKVSKNLNTDEYFVHSNNDPKSDQSYLLSGIDQDHLKNLMLPLGELRADEVLKIGERFGLNEINSKPKELFCFRDKDSYMERAKQKIAPSLIKEGQIQNLDTGSISGDHEGMLNHFMTETDLDFKDMSHGDKELEIVGFNYGDSTIKIGSKKHLTFQGTQLVDLSLNGGIDRSRPLLCYVKNKYSSDYINAHLYFNNNDAAFLDFREDIYPLISDECITIFDKNTRNAKVIGTARVGGPGNFELIDRVEEFRSSDEGEVDDEENNDSSAAHTTMFKF